MLKTVARRQEHLKFDAWMQFLEEEFEQIPDHRTNNVTYSLASVLQAAFAMFSLKCPSLLDFQTQTVPERSNLRSIYRIKGQTPGDSQMRATLDYLDDIHQRALFSALYRRICEVGMLSHYKYWQEYVLVSVDGVEHFSSTKVHCPSCTTRRLRNGKISYHHAALAAVIFHPDEKEVIPIEIEPIIKQDGEQKMIASEMRRKDCAKSSKRVIQSYRFC